MRTDPAAPAGRRGVLILAYCGHRRWVAADGPMNAEARAVEKCRPCPDCPARR